MPGIIKLNQYRSNTGDSGFRMNSTTKEVEHIGPGDFYFNVQGLMLIPANKQMAGFYYTGSDQTFVMPSTSGYIFAKLWGGGGGGGCQGGWNHGGEGGGGGHTRALIPVSQGTSITVRVPRGGYANPGATNAWPGGGSSTTGGDNQYTAGGAGYAAILIGGTVYLVAGGGGGGGSTTAGGMNYQQHGGAGGGTTGQRGWNFNNIGEAGGGGTQSGGGAGGTGGNATGQAGSSLQGGSCNGNTYGGGGGGGYYGGGAGSYGGSGNMGGGGGGSGFVHSSCFLGGTFTGSRTKPGLMEDSDLPKNKSYFSTPYGHGGNFCDHGGDGFICIYY